MTDLALAIHYSAGNNRWPSITIRQIYSKVPTKNFVPSDPLRQSFFKLYTSQSRQVKPTHVAVTLNWTNKFHLIFLTTIIVANVCLLFHSEKELTPALIKSFCSPETPQK